MQHLKKNITDVLIIGSGIAGLSLALRLSKNCNITVLSKSLLQESSTLYAQGGIAVVLDKKDNINFHIKDTLECGVGICDHKIVKFVVENALHCIEWLIKQGVSFEKDTVNSQKNNYHLHREGGHSHRRIIHSKDCTGKEIEFSLIEKVKKNKNINIIENCYVIDLIINKKLSISKNKKIVGVYYWNNIEKKIKLFRSKIVVLATGGASKVYKNTTNPHVSSGDGIAMAWRAGCRVANLEFNQFHPTCLFHENSSGFLITEAMRGEGAYLKRPDGSRFMFDFDKRGELAPRDIISRAINYEMKRLKINCMYLDISHKSYEFILCRFPTIYSSLLKLGLDLTKKPIPIVPSAHYTCGGIIVNKYGKTDINGLYAIGEVSYTGLHGANRLASNSLLECLVYSWSAYEDILRVLPFTGLIDFSFKRKENNVEYFDQSSIIKNIIRELRCFMWDNAGIVKVGKKLKQSLDYIEKLQSKINWYYLNFSMSNELIEIRNLVLVAKLIITSSIRRKESRGLHYILDYPNILKSSKPTVLIP